MFRAVKQSYELEVRFDGKTVRVKTLAPQKTRSLFDRTLAHCEEFLAQVSLQEQKAKQGLAQLVLHFKNRGWQVVF